MVNQIFHPIYGQKHLDLFLHSTQMVYAIHKIEVVTTIYHVGYIVNQSNQNRSKSREKCFHNVRFDSQK